MLMPMSCSVLIEKFLVSLNLIDDQAEKRMVVGIGEEPAEVNTTLFAMRVTPTIERKPSIGRHRLAGDGTAQRFFIAADVEAISMRIHEVMFVTAADDDAVVDVADDVRTGRAIHVAFFCMRIVVELELQLRVERPLTRFVNDVDHRLWNRWGFVIAEIRCDL